MSKGRLEAFSDAVIAIAITIMVLELRVPHGTDWQALRPLVPVFLTYLLSFVFLVASMSQSPAQPVAVRSQPRANPSPGSRPVM